MAGMAFSVLSTGFFLYPVIKDLLPSNTAGDTLVKITVGSTGIQGEPDYMGGSIPYISLFTEDGELLGRASGNGKKTWAYGTTNPVYVKPNNGMAGKQATYVAVGAGGSDAICISAISVSWPDGSNPKVWLGDLAANCSDIMATNTPFWANSVTQTGDNPQYQSKCVYIDGIVNGDVTAEAIGLHITDFGRTDGAFDGNGGLTTNPVAEQWNDNRDLLCGATPRMYIYDSFGSNEYPDIYQPPLSYNPNGTDVDPDQVLHGSIYMGPTRAKDKFRRRVRRRPTFSKRMESTIVHSANPFHSAKETCNSQTSISPDFVSYTEGLFCDMSTRTLWLLCSAQITTDCFDAHLNKLVFDRVELHKRDLEDTVSESNKIYEQIVHW
jgi:hypothetical protein